MSDENEKLQLTIAAYDDHAPAYTEKFWRNDLSDLYARFLPLLPPKARILDLGCGPGRDLAAFAQQGFKVVGADLSIGLLRQAQARTAADLVHADMRALPFHHSVFDAAWLSASLLHIPRTQAPTVLSGLHRVISPGGALFLAVKQGDGEFLRQDQGERNFVFFQPEEIHTLLKAARFTIQQTWIHADKKQTWINILASK